MKAIDQKWIEKYPNYWVNKESNWVVRDYPADNDMECGWVILDNNNMMISCEYKENKESCMEEADNIVAEESIYGIF